MTALSSHSKASRHHMARLIEKTPEDPQILFSYINMFLRDEYPSLDALCDDLGLDKAAIEKTLASAGYTYSEKYNKFW